MKKLLALMMALAMVLALAACGSTGTGSAKSAADGSGSAAAGNADGKTYKVGIVNWVDHASLNQIIENLEAELDRQGEALRHLRLSGLLRQCAGRSECAEPDRRQHDRR